MITLCNKLNSIIIVNIHTSINKLDESSSISTTVATGALSTHSTKSADEDTAVNTLLYQFGAIFDSFVNALTNIPHHESRADVSSNGDIGAMPSGLRHLNIEQAAAVSLKAAPQPQQTVPDGPKKHVPEEELLSSPVAFLGREGNNYDGGGYKYFTVENIIKLVKPAVFVKLRP